MEVVSCGRVCVSRKGVKVDIQLHAVVSWSARLTGLVESLDVPALQRFNSGSRPLMPFQSTLLHSATPAAQSP